MCVWCPLWPIQRRLSVRAELRQRPFILYAETQRNLSVATCSPEAADWGIRIGMPLGEARSLLPAALERRQRNRSSKPIFERTDPSGDRTELRELALAFQRYSPLVGLEDRPAPESLWLDISGSEALFGGELELIEVIRRDLAQRGIRARFAIADTWGAAWALSHYSDSDVVVIPKGQQEIAIAQLPIEALRLSDPVIESLRALDVITIGQLRALPRTSLPSRFGKELLQRLDQATGGSPELLTAERLLEPVTAEWPFEEPVSDQQILEQVYEVLLDRVVTSVESRQAAIKELTCQWLGCSTEPISLRLLRPTLDRRYLAELLKLQCERCQFESGVSGVRIDVVEMALPTLRQATLFDDGTNKKQERSLVELVDRLSSRLGCQAVLRSNLFPDPLPELSCQTTPWVKDDAPVRSKATSWCLRCRPLRLLRVPQQLQVERYSNSGVPSQIQRSSVMRFSGPERIESGWWRGRDTKRDYYRLDLDSGSRLWVFCDRSNGRWFLHGLFS